MLEGLIGAGLSTIGSLASSAINNSESRKAREWQERMANTAHQREVKDLRAAGLNPILGFSRGMGGADTPTPNVPRMENPLQEASASFSAAQTNRLNNERLAMEKAVNVQQLATMKADQTLKEAQAGEARSRGENTQLDTMIRTMFEANPERAGLLMTLLQKEQLLKESQITANQASAKLSNYQAQVRSPTEVFGKVLEQTLTGGGKLSIPYLIDLIMGRTPPTTAKGKASK